MAMVLWNRLNQSKLKTLLSHQFRRCYFQISYAAPLLSPTSNASKPNALHNPFFGLHRRPTEFCTNVRFYQVKKEEDDDDGPRLNDAITARFVRLVTDEGHSVVSFHDALQQAKKLNLDLVEVARKADPPVCKIMNFNKEKYKKEMVMKERAKSKAKETLKKGDLKEVRFSAKTELKDLKMKADMVRRLTERGYQVKVMAQISQKKAHKQKKVSSNEDEENGDGEDIMDAKRENEYHELIALVSELITLVEDVCVVVTGPMLAKQNAYAVVQHIKFGSPKKGGSAKKSKDVQSREPTAKEDTEKPADTPGAIDNPQVMHDSKGTDSFPSSPQIASPVENRYQRTETRSHRFPEKPGYINQPDTRESFRFEPRIQSEVRQSQEERNRAPGFDRRFSNNGRQPQPEVNGAPLTRDNRRPIGSEFPAFRNTGPPPREMHRSEPDHAHLSNTPPPGYGIFSRPTATPQQAKDGNLHDHATRNINNESASASSYGVSGRR